MYREERHERSKVLESVITCTKITMFAQGIKNLARSAASFYLLCYNSPNSGQQKSSDITLIVLLLQKLRRFSFFWTRKRIPLQNPSFLLLFGALYNHCLGFYSSLKAARQTPLKKLSVFFPGHQIPSMASS